MKLKALTTLVLAGLMLAGTYVHASDHDTATVQETYLGKLEFQGQSITKKTAEFLHRQILLQRATQLVTWAMPMMNFEQLYPALLSNMRAAEDDVFFGLYDGYDGVYPFMTANVTTPYTIAFSDLSKTGPVVVDLPPGAIYGVIDNAWMQPIHEINGNPGKLLLVGPGQDIPKDFDGTVVQSDTFRVLYFYRALGTGDEAKELRTAVKAYKLSEAANPPKTKFVKYEPKPGDKIALNTQPRDMQFWELVNAYVQREPMADRDRFFYAWLKDLGIEKGKDFKPTVYQKDLLQKALDAGMAMSQAISFNKTRNMFPTSLYGKDSGWEDAMAGMNPKIDLPTYSEFNERASYGFEATTTSAGMVSRVPGKGSAYLGSYYDADGNALMGGNNYKLRIEPNPPAANFWSITVYDIENRLIIRNETKRSDRSSRTEGLIKNADGSVDMYFGSTAPEGKEVNWIQTNAGQSFFVYLRLYGPEKAYFDQSFPMNKIQKLEMTTQPPKMKMTTDIPASITVPASVDSSIGKLEYFDGVPTKGTVDAVFDYVDRARAVEVFINMMPAVSMYQLRQGQRDVGAKASNQILIWEKLMDSKSLVLTGNNTSLYTWGFLDLKKDGPTVIELPANVLGILDDGYMRYLADMGAAGPDHGKGGKYLVLPPGYDGQIPGGYYVVKSPTYTVWNMMRGYTKGGVAQAAAAIKEKLKVYPLAKKDNPPKMQFINMSGRDGYNTVPPTDLGFYEELNALIQEEPIEWLDPELRGQIAAIGIVKGKPFAPDARMKKILNDAQAIGNAYARANTVFPRDPGQRIYGPESEWVMAFADKQTDFLTDGIRRMDSRLWMHFNAIAVTPAMALTKPGAGSDYAIAGLDAKHQALDGSKTYKLHLPPNVPVKDNWSVTIYDTQTRCMLQTDQQYAGINSLGEGLKKNPDGSIDLYFAPQAPKGMENNWIQSIPEKSWFIILRAYGPLQPWIDKTWRPSEIELVK